MNRVKRRITLILALLAALVLTLSLAIGLPFFRVNAAQYSPDDIFAAGEGASVTAYKADEDATPFVGLNMRNESKVYYRRDLAFKWFEKDTAASSNMANPGKAVYFSLGFAFLDYNFKTFKIVLESSEENVTKDAKTTNEITFSPFVDEADNRHKIAVVVNGDEDNAENIDYETLGTAIVLSFKGEGETAGDFGLSLKLDGSEQFPKIPSNPADDFEYRVFSNIGDNYAEYRSSANSNPLTPLTFETETEGDAAAMIQLLSLNGQSFEVVDGADGDTTDTVVEVQGGKVEDNKVPALVLSEELHAFTLGTKFSLSYKAIDVLKDSVSVTRRYNIATKNTDGTWNFPAEDKSDDYSTLSTSTYFMPIDDKNASEAYISIRFELDDSTNTKDQEHYVYLTWYATDEAIATFTNETDDGTESHDYIKAVAKLDRNPVYTTVTPDDQTQKNEATNGDLVADYQKLVDEAAENTSAGTGSYIYLPSLRNLIESKYADYRNLKFSVYYFTQEQTEDSTAISETSLSYNALKVEVSTEGKYVFRVLATDADGNGIKLYDEHGELVEVTGSNIWDFDEIPEFTFNIIYSGATIEDAEEQDLGYRDSVYSIKNFEVIALSGYISEYSLYYFDESLLDTESNPMPTYSEFVRAVNEYLAKEAYAKCLTEISTFNSELDEEDDAEAWAESDNDYRWNPDSSLSFCPQKSGFYVVQITVTDPNRSNEVTTGYQVIEVRNPLDVTPGKSIWLENNIVSVVLFSISGVLLVIIIILCIVKPSEDKVEAVDLDKLKGNKKSKKNNKK